MEITERFLRVEKPTPWEEAFCWAYDSTMGQLPKVASRSLFDQIAQEGGNLEYTAFRTWVRSQRLDSRLTTRRFYRWLVRGHRIFQEANERGVSVAKDQELIRRVEDWKKDRPFSGPAGQFRKLNKTAGLLLLIGVGSCLVGLFFDPPPVPLVHIGFVLTVVGLAATIVGYRAAGK